MFFALLWACSPKQNSSSTDTQPVRTAPVELETPSYILPSTPQFGPETRRKWPFTEWTTAKAYAYNMTNFGPGASLFVYREGEWNSSIVKEIALTESQAQAALELNHRLGGDVRVSKCAFPRHSVVFFDNDNQPVGSVNVCFECGDILVWPPYYNENEDLSFRYAQAENAEMPTFIDFHEKTLPVWEDLLMTTVGLPAFVRGQ